MKQKPPIKMPASSNLILIVTFLLSCSDICVSQPKFKIPPGYVSPISFAQFSADGKLIVTISKRKKVTTLKSYIYDPVNGKSVISVSKERLNSENKIKLWETANGQFRGKIKHPFPDKPWDGIETRNLHVKFSPDGRWILTILFLSPSDMFLSPSFDLVKIWEAKTGKLIHSFDNYHGNIICTQFSPNGKWIAISNVFGSIEIWEIDPIKLSTRIKLREWTEMDFSPDSRWMVTKSYDEIKLWETSEFKLVHEIAVPGSWPHSASFTQDGRWIALTCSDGIVRIWETASGRLVHSLPNTTNEDSIILSFRDRIMFIPTVEFSTDDRWILASHPDKTAKIWDAESGKLIRSLEGHTSPIKSAQFSPDGKWVVTSTWGLTSLVETIKIWDSASGENIRTIKGTSLKDIDWTTSKILSCTGSEISIFDFTDDQYSLSFHVIGSRDWIVTHPSGLWDASPGAMNKKFFLEEIGLIELGKLRDKYFEPDLWEKVMSGKPIRIVEE